jgi:hypothetical protein
MFFLVDDLDVKETMVQRLRPEVPRAQIIDHDRRMKR